MNQENEQWTIQFDLSTQQLIDQIRIYNNQHFKIYLILLLQLKKSSHEL